MLRSFSKLNQILMIFVILLGSGIKFSYADPARASQFPSFADLIEKVSPSVVSISVDRKIKNTSQTNFQQIPEPFREFFNIPKNARPNLPERHARAEGSGFFISGDGYVVTNNHVIAGGDKITVITKDKKKYKAKIIGVDPLTDLALLKVENKGKKFSYVAFDENPKLRVGDWVVAVGNPYGLDGTATAGIISATKRNTGTDSTSYYDFIQISAPINRGNSGGPAFSLEGKVIGVNSQIYSPSGGNIGIGFAIPSEVASRVIHKLKEKGQIIRGWLGVTISSVDQDIANSAGLKDQKGAIIQNVSESSPAKKYGLEPGDIILSINNIETINPTTATRQIGAMDVGEKAHFKINRFGKEKRLTILIGKHPDSNIINSSYTKKTDSMKSSESLIGISIRPLGREEALNYQKDGKAKGVLITKIENNSPAAEKGLRPGLLITKINRQVVLTPDNFINAIKAAKKENKKAVLMFIQNPRGQKYSLGVPLKKG